MATKKITKKEEAEKKEAAKAERYFYAVGKRKTAIATVRIYPSDKAEAEVTVNDRTFENYFSIPRLRDLVKEPLALAGADAKFDVSAKVRGGGTNAQAEAIRLGISRALVEFNPELRKSLRDNGLLTRDSRIVERKKPGLRKARRAPQWAKR